MGDHVKVIAGRYEGDTGLIVRVEENFVILFSDLTMHEVDLHLSEDVRGVLQNQNLSVCPAAEGAAQRPAALL